MKSFKYIYNGELATRDIISFHHLESCLFSIAKTQKLSNKVGLDNKNWFYYKHNISLFHVNVRNFSRLSNLLIRRMNTTFWIYLHVIGSYTLIWKLISYVIFLIFKQIVITNRANILLLIIIENTQFLCWIKELYTRK